ncbi:hypothetical protein D3C87_1122450 [compost metagenome]
MSAEQQAFTPIVGVTTDFHVDRCVADVEVAPDKGIENLSRRAVHVALHFVAVTIVVIAGGVAGNVTFHIVIVIGLVKPAGTTEASTPLVEVGKVEFAQHIETICNNVAFIELAVGLVEVRRVHDATVLTVSPHAQVVADRVVPTQAIIRVRQIERERHDALRAANHHQRKRTLSQYQPTLLGLMIHTHYLLLLFSVAMCVQTVAPAICATPQYR